MDVHLLVVVCAVAIGVAKTNMPASGGLHPQARSTLPAVSAQCYYLLSLLYPMVKLERPGDEFETGVGGEKPEARAVRDAPMA